MKALETYERAGLKVSIFQDLDPENPRQWSNVGTMVCFHNRYDLGDQHEYHADDFDNWNKLKERLVKDGAAIIFPLYLYDHSGITISTSSFNSSWDSGQVGFIFATGDDIKEAYQTKNLTDDVIARAKEGMEQEVRTYDQYLTGDVYGFVVESIETCDHNEEHAEHLESCWGFYGMDDAREAANDAADTTAKAAL